MIERIILKQKLVIPREEFRETYTSFINEFISREEELIPFPLRFPHENFKALVSRLADQSKGVGIPDGFVPSSTYWLIDETSALVGVSNLRHELTPNLEREGGHIGFGVRPSSRRQGFGSLLLKETLQEARGIGIERLLVACDKKNIASAGTIIVNGGVLSDEEFLPEHGFIVQRYWIDI